MELYAEVDQAHQLTTFAGKSGREATTSIRSLDE
jgi:hypothetical protein